MEDDDDKQMISEAAIPCSSRKHQLEREYFHSKPYAVQKLFPFSQLQRVTCLTCSRVINIALPQTVCFHNFSNKFNYLKTFFILRGYYCRKQNNNKTSPCCRLEIPDTTDCVSR